MGKVSIIVPVFNMEKYVEDCISSVLKQTHENIEIILINNGSNLECTDQLHELAKRDKRIKLYQLPKRRGLGFARNFAIQQTTGDYIYFLNSDDYIPSETIELLLGNIGKRDIIKGKTITTDLSSSFTITFRGLFNPEIYTENRFELIKDNSVRNILFKKDFIINQNIKFTNDSDCFSDLEFLFLAFEKVNSVLFLEEAIYFQRQYPDLTTNPSISHMEQPDRIEEFLFAYTDLKFEVIEDEAHSGLDQNLIDFYQKEIVGYFYDNDAINAIFPSLYKATLLMDKQVLERYDRVLKKEIQTIISGNLYKFKDLMKRKHLIGGFREKSENDQPSSFFQRIFT